MRFVYENPDWPNFHWDKKALAPVLARAKEELLALQDLFFAKSPAVRERTILETLCQDTMASSAIEGEGLNEGSVRAILSDFLGFLDSGATKARGCAREEGPARMQFDATQNPRGLRKIVSLPGTRSFLALAGSTLSQAPSAHQSREPCVSFPGTAAEKGCISWPPGQSALQGSLSASGPG